jgi:5'-nucleotidase
MRILITNDDGIASRGLDALVEVCDLRGWEAVVVAPADDRSGSSAAIGRIALDEELHLLPAPREVPGAAETYVVEGPPGLASLVACRGGIGPVPDLVRSGINAGANTGHSILHSGTVGAALTAASFGVSGLAVSVDVSEPMRWDTAAAFAARAIEIVTRAPRGTVLNLNVPAADASDVRGLRWARLDRFGTVRVAVASRSGTALQLEYRATELELEPDSDTALLAAGYATLTSVEGISEVDPGAIDEQDDRRPGPEPRLTELPAEARSVRFDR